mmetsp:Transcript_106976/g.300898  ORF Transcript_106976/g.300898 Transcript_106976/m.300898 type:complete len:219 (+) Transcript_106976:1251-1907(+)
MRQERIAFLAPSLAKEFCLLGVVVAVPVDVCWHVGSSGVRDFATVSELGQALRHLREVVQFLHDHHVRAVSLHFLAESCQARLPISHSGKVATSGRRVVLGLQFAKLALVLPRTDHLGNQCAERRRVAVRRRHVTCPSWPIRKHGPHKETIAGQPIGQHVVLHDANRALDCLGWRRHPCLRDRLWRHAELRETGLPPVRHGGSKAAWGERVDAAGWAA